MTEKAMFAVACLPVLSWATDVCSDPLMFPTYDQALVAEFASAADAAAALSKMAPLPNGASRAFSTRWDDTTPAHIAKADMLERAGVKGGFYFVGNSDGNFFEKGARELVARGHAVGNHTLNHPFMLELSDNRIFREVLENRIRIETVIDRSVVSYVSPYGWYGRDTTDDHHRTKAVEMIVETGHWVSDDNPLPEAGVPNDIWYPANRFAADDRNPTWELFEKGLKAQMKIADGNPLAPRIVLGTHSWCDAAGLARQEKWLRENCLRPDWIQLNDYEYGAYRYSFLNGAVRKVSANGSRATFAVTRFDPSALGHLIPLSLKFSREPVRITCGGRALEKGANGTWTLPHDASRTTVRAVARADVAGVSAKIPGVVFTVAPDAARGVLRLVLKNGTDAALSDLYGVAHLPPEFLTRRRTFSVTSVKAGETLVKEISFGAVDHAAFAVDASLYAASVDFTQPAGRVRFWATAERPAPKTMLLPRDVARWTSPIDGARLDDATLAAISADRGPLPTQDGLVWHTGTFREAAWYNVSIKNKVYSKSEQALAATGKAVEAVALQFTAPETGEVKVLTNIAFTRGAVIYLNGEKVPFAGKAFTLPAKPGLNRLVARVPLGKNVHYARALQIAVHTKSLGSPIPCVPLPEAR